MLASVTSPGASPDVRTYHYENSADRQLLTGISINGVRYSTYKYYADKRVQESGLAGGEGSFAGGTGQVAGGGLGMAGRVARFGHLDLAPRPGARQLDGLARTVVVGLFLLEEMEDVLRTIGRPQRQQVVVGVQEGAAAAHGD